MACKLPINTEPGVSCQILSLFIVRATWHRVKMSCASAKITLAACAFCHRYRYGVVTGGSDARVPPVFSAVESEKLSKQSCAGEPELVENRFSKDAGNGKKQPKNVEKKRFFVRL